jgi:DNA invertase Pin-like site-specific DNA recombinase
MPVAAYLRMSSDDQEGSIDQQRREILAFVQGKHRVVAWYVDEGKSASKDQEKRTAFRRMILDSAKGEWQAIVVWKTNRFARLDSQEGAADKRVLRKHGVRLISVKDGVIDWDTMEGRIIDTVRSEMDHHDSVTIASDSLRGRKKRLVEDGCWCNGSVPYAYHRNYIAPDGREVLVQRTQSFRKPAGWLLKLVVCVEEAEVVRWIFEQVTAHDRSLCSIARALNERGVPSPTALGKGTGRCWTVTMLAGKRGILSNPAYCGFGYCGAGRTNKRGAFCLADNVRKAGVCPVVVDAATWELAQTILARRSRKKRRPMKGSGALSGVARCAHCGHRMALTHRKGRLAYVCNSQSLRPGKSPCRRWKVWEDELLPKVCGRLVEVVDGELLKALQVETPAADRLSDLDMLRAHMATLEKQTDEAARRYLTAPAHRMPALGQQLDALREELAACEQRLRTLAAANNEGAVSNFVSWWRGVRSSLLLLRVEPGTREEQAAAAAAAAFWSGVREHAEPHEAPAVSWNEDGDVAGGQDGAFVLAEPAALRSLLTRLGITVTCFFVARDTRTKLTPGRGRGPSYLLQRAVLTWGENGRHEDETVANVYQ